jgi:NADH-quinone oxidoreductase subunit I
VTFKNIINRAFLGEIIKGMALTLKMMFTKPVTILYPEQKRHVYDGFRGRHAFVRDPVTGKEKCIGCMKCANICPAQCITIVKEKIENKLTVVRYDIEALRCIYCAYCVEICPVCALVLTEEYEYSATKRSDLTFNKDKLLQNWDEFIAKLPKETYFNKFWRPEGIDTAKMPKSKREQGPVSTKLITNNAPSVPSSDMQKETP